MGNLQYSYLKEKIAIRVTGFQGTMVIIILHGALIQI